MSLPPIPASLLDNEGPPPLPASLRTDGASPPPPPPPSILDDNDGAPSSTPSMGEDEIPTDIPTIIKRMEDPAEPQSFSEWQSLKRSEREQEREYWNERQRKRNPNYVPPTSSPFKTEADRLADEFADRMQYAFSGYKIPPLKEFSKALAPDWEKFQTDIETISAEHPIAGKAAIIAGTPTKVGRQFLSDIVPETAEGAVEFAMFPKAIKALGEMFPALARPLFTRLAHTPEGQLLLPAPKAPEPPKPTTEFTLIPKTRELAKIEDDPFVRMIDEELRYQKALEEKALLNRPVTEQQPFVDPARAERGALNEPIPDRPLKPIAPKDVRFQAMTPEEIRYQRALENKALLNRNVPPNPLDFEAQRAAEIRARLAEPAPEQPLSPLEAAEQQARYEQALNANKPGTVPEPGPLQSEPFKTPQPGPQRDPDPLQGQPFMTEAKWKALKRAQQKNKSTLQLIKEINDGLGNRGAVGPGGEPPKFPEIEPQIRELIDRAQKEGYKDRDGILAFAAREGFKARELHKVKRALEPTGLDAVIIPPEAEAIHKRILENIEKFKIEDVPPEEAEAIHKRFGKSIKSFKDIVTNDKLTLSEKSHALYQAYVNRFHGIERAGDMASKEAGGLPDGFDPGLQASSYLGSPGKVRAMHKDGTFRTLPNGDIQWTGPGLLRILEKVKGSEMDFDAYLAARTIQARAESGVPTPKQFTPKDAFIERIYMEKKYPHFKAVADEVNKFGRLVLMYLYDSGRIGVKDLQRLFYTYPFHVPLERVMESLDSGRLARLGQGVMKKGELFSRVPNPLKRNKGTDKELDIIAPLDTLAQNVFKIVDAADRNRVAVSLVKARANSPTLASQMPEVTRPGRDTITAYVDGVPRHFKVLDPLLLSSLKSMDSASADMLTAFMSKFSRVLRAGATLDPDFSVRNPGRDIQSALGNAKHGITPQAIITGTQELLADLAGARGLPARMRAAGAYQSYLADVGKGMEEIRNAPPGYHQDVLDSVKNPLKSLVKALEMLSNASEAPTRMGVAVKAKQGGMSDQRAGREMRQSTGDFLRRGSEMQSLSKVVAFLNARIQMFDKGVRSFREQPLRKGTMAGLAAGVSYWNWLAYHEKDWYKNLQEDQKNRYWFYEGPKGLIRVAKGDDGQLFGTTLEKTMDYWKDIDRPSLMAWALKTADNISPVSIRRAEMIPNAMRTPLENVTDYDLFRMRPMTPASVADRKAEHQWDTQTSETMKQLAYLMSKAGRKVFDDDFEGFSPIHLEHLVTGFTGGLGRRGLQISDLALEKAGVVPPKSRAPRELSDYPIIGAFTARDPIGTRSRAVNDFYNNKERSTRAEASLEASVEDMEALITLPMNAGGLPKNLAEAKIFRPRTAQDRIIQVLDEFPEIMFYKIFKSQAEAMTDLNRMRQMVIYNQTMDEDVKRGSIRLIEQFQTKMAENTNAQFREYMRNRKSEKLKSTLGVEGSSTTRVQ